MMVDLFAIWNFFRQCGQQYCNAVTANRSQEIIGKYVDIGCFLGLRRDGSWSQIMVLARDVPALGLRCRLGATHQGTRQGARRLAFAVDRHAGNDGRDVPSGLLQ